MERCGQIGSSSGIGQSKFLLGIVVLAAALRASVLLWPGAFAVDPDSYQRVASNLVQRGVFALNGEPSAYRPPLYPLVLSAVMVMPGCNWRTAVGILHWSFGVGTVLCVMLIMRWRGPWAGVWAVLLVAADPLLLHHSRLIMTETQSAFLVALTLAVFFHAVNSPKKVWWFFGGGLLGLCCLTRPTFLPWPLVTVVIWFAGEMWPKRGSPSQSAEEPLGSAGFGRKVGQGSLTKLIQAALVFGGITLTVAPWVVRNWLIFGRPILGTTHGGYTFYLANNPWYYDYLSRPRPKPVWDAAEFNSQWEEIVRDRLGGDELLADRLAYQLAFQTISEQPGMFLRACLDRFWQLWRLVPHRLEQDETFLRTATRYAVGAFYLFQYGLIGIAVICGIKNHSLVPSHRVIEVLGCALVLTVTGVHLFYWTNMRMRAPLTPVLAICAAEGGRHLFSFLRRRLKSP
ncbi:MAG: ArnT family glycosyltransferase [Thermogutta sp.]